MGINAHPGQKGREKNAHQLQTALAYTDRAKHEERGFKACRWPDHKYDSQHGKRRDTLARICETLDCGIMDVIELVSDEPSTTGGNDNGKTERKNHRERH